MCCTIANVTSFLVHRLSLRLYTPHICLNVHSRNNAKLGHELVPRKLNKIYSVPQWCVGEGKEPSMWAKCETTDWRRPRSEIDSVLHTSISEKALLAVLLLGRVFPYISAHIWSLLHIQPGKHPHQWWSRNFSVQNRLATTPYWLPCLWVNLNSMHLCKLFSMFCKYWDIATRLTQMQFYWFDLLGLLTVHLLF